jgi:hypothetical protein
MDCATRAAPDFEKAKETSSDEAAFADQITKEGNSYAHPSNVTAQNGRDSNQISLEALMTRWTCSRNMAMRRVRRHYLGCNPAGTWIISLDLVRAYEENLRTSGMGTTNNSPAPSISPNTVNDKFLDDLKKRGVLRARSAPPIYPLSAAAKYVRRGK